MLDEDFGRQSIEALLKTQWAGRRILYFEELDSTNIQAKREADKGAEEGLLIVANCQSAGRGRRGRSWSSPPGCNVYFTLLLRPKYKPAIASMVTLVMALAVAEAITMTGEAEGNLPAIQEEGAVAIKWPNDIVVRGRKLCGMLTEMQTEGTAIGYTAIGVGINVATQTFPPELADTAVCLQEAWGRRISRSLLIANIMKAFETRYEAFCGAENLAPMLGEYNRLLVNRDRQVRVLDPKGEYDGTCRGINEMGELLVEDAAGKIHPVYAGEVSVRGIYGYV